MSPFANTSTTLTRRRFVAGGMTALAGVAVLSTSAAAARLMRTPAQSLGPFYPDALPLDRDNDLVRVDGRDAPALGHVTHVFGRIRDIDGRPVPAARVEIWQCDANGRYIHTGDFARGRNDPNFQGYGATQTGDDGGYRFRTIRPVAYSGRAPHIHFAIKGPGSLRLVTQMYVAGEPRNESDFLLRRIRDSRDRDALIVPLQPMPALEEGALGGRFDIVLGSGSWPFG